MALSFAAIQAAKPQAKPFKLYDEKGLFLLIAPAGGKLWRLKYHFQDRERLLALGSFPELGLKEARNGRDEARKLIAQGISTSGLRPLSAKLA